MNVMNKTENIAKKNKTGKTIISVRGVLIVLQITFIAFMLVAEWTALNEKVVLFFYMLPLSEWGKIMFYIPLVFVLHVSLMNGDKYYFIGVAVYAAVFLLESITLFALIAARMTSKISDVFLDFNVCVKVFELTIVGIIIYLLYHLAIIRKFNYTEEK